MALPQTVRDKWYDIDVPEETRAKGDFLIKWLEKQRQNAVRVRLDTMAARLRTPATPAGKQPPARGESTDKGLNASLLHAQATDRSSSAGAGSGAKIQTLGPRIPRQVSPQARKNPPGWT